MNEAAEAKKRRKRKTKDEVDRNFTCPIPNCGKAYGCAKQVGELAQPAHQAEASGPVGPAQDDRGAQ